MRMPAPSPVFASRPAGAAVLQVDQHLETPLDDRVRPAALDVHDEADAAGVVLEARVIQALGLRGHERSLLGHENVLGAQCLSPM